MVIYIAYWSNYDGEFAAAMLDSPYESALGRCSTNEAEWYVPGTDWEDPAHEYEAPAAMRVWSYSQGWLR